MLLIVYLLNGNDDENDENNLKNGNYTKKQEQQYAEWLAACRLAAKGKTLADSRWK